MTAVHVDDGSQCPSFSFIFELPDFLKNIHSPNPPSQNHFCNRTTAWNTPGSFFEQLLPRQIKGWRLAQFSDCLRNCCYRTVDILLRILFAKAEAQAWPRFFTGESHRHKNARWIGVPCGASGASRGLNPHFIQGKNPCIAAHAIKPDVSCAAYKSWLPSLPV